MSRVCTDWPLVATIYAYRADGGILIDLGHYYAGLNCYLEMWLIMREEGVEFTDE
jgi:hypothetical protein